MSQADPGATLAVSLSFTEVAMPSLPSRSVLALVALSLVACSDEDIAPEALAPSACGHECSPNAVCEKTADGTASCVCKDGFAGDGKTCGGVGGCGNCADEATCELGAGGHAYCKCPDGYEGNGRVCEKELAASECGTCRANSTCVQSATGNRCRCNPGYYLDNDVCKKPSTCAEGNGGCHLWAACTMSGGQPTCACANGTIGDGYSCVTPGNGALALKVKLEVGYTGSGPYSSCGATWAVNEDSSLTPTAPGSKVYARKGLKVGTGTDYELEGDLMVEFVDELTGEIRIDFDLKTTQKTSPTASCTQGAPLTFKWITTPDAEVGYVGLPQELTLLGNPFHFAYQASGVTVTSFTGTVTLEWP